MSLLIGMREGETLTRLLAALPQRRERRALAHEGGAFFDAAREAFETIVLHMELVADRYPWEWIHPLRSLRPEARIVVVPSEEAYDSLWLEAAERLALEAEFVWAPLGAGPEEIAAIVSGSLLGDFDPAEPGSRGIVATVWSAASKDGATTVAANVAVTLAREAPTLRVGLLDLNLKNPELRVALRAPDGGRTNAALRPKLQTGALSPAELRESTAPYRKQANLRLLYGTHRRDTAADVGPEMMETLLSVCRRTFDVTILDVSSFPDNAATVCGVRGADVRWLVAGNRSPSYLWSWGEWYACYWKLCGLAASDVELVCNRFDPEGEPADKAAAALGMPLAAVVPNVPGGIGVRMAEEGRPLVDAPQAGDFAASVCGLASRLHEATGREALPERETPRRRSGLVSLLSGLF
jgi:pilus assembly protein CpaE